MPEKCNTDQMKDLCSEEVNNMSAVEACKAIQEKATNMWDFLREGANTLNPVSMMTDLIKTLGASADTKQDIFSNIRTSLSSKSFAEQISSCSNITVTEQSNEIRGMSDQCVANLLAAGKSIEEIQSMNTVTGVTQENIQQSISVCQINQLTDLLTKMDATIDNQALLEVVNKIKGLMSGSSTKQTVCTNIDMKMSACKYIKQSQCCVSDINTKQSNLIDTGCLAGGWANISQKNDSTVLNQCLLSASSNMSDEMIAKIFNKSGASSKNDIEGLTPSFLIVVACIIALVLFGPSIMIKSLGSSLSGGSSAKIFYILGFIVGLIGIILIVLYFVNTTPESYRENKPYVLCESTKSENPSAKETYGEVKNKVNSNSKYVGFDFVTDINNVNDGSIADDKLGVPVYLTSIDRNNNDNCGNYNEENSYVKSYIKTYRNIKYIIIGCVLLVCSVILVIVGTTRTSSSPSSVLSGSSTQSLSASSSDLDKSS
jgi:hypothetical protein